MHVHINIDFNIEFNVNIYFYTSSTIDCCFLLLQSSVLLHVLLKVININFKVNINVNIKKHSYYNELRFFRYCNFANDTSVPLSHDAKPCFS